MNAPSIFLNQQYTDRDLIQSIIASFYIIDYGFINKVNGDKTVDVTHAKRLKSLEGDDLPETTTKNVEVLTLAAGAFSLSIDYQEGDQVLLLGLKDYVDQVAEVTQSTESTVYLHYSRSTLKALPLCVFNSEAKIKLEAAEGTLKVTTEQKLELNGNDKQFVTWAELNQALQSLWTSIKTHTHPVSTTGTAAAQTGTAATSLDLATVTLDISSAKTTTVVTGG